MFYNLVLWILRYAQVLRSVDLFESNDTLFFYKSNSLLLADLQEQRQRRMRNSTQNLNPSNVSANLANPSRIQNDKLLCFNALSTNQTCESTKN